MAEGLSHAYKDTDTKEYNNAHTNKEKTGIHYFLLTCPHKCTQSSQLCFQISVKGYKERGEKSAIKQAKETTEHCAEAALPFSPSVWMCT